MKFVQLFLSEIERHFWTSEQWFSKYKDVIQNIIKHKLSSLYFYMNRWKKSKSSLTKFILKLIIQTKESTKGDY
jgi:hypothetical protein